MIHGWLTYARDDKEDEKGVDNRFNRCRERIDDILEGLDPAEEPHHPESRSEEGQRLWFELSPTRDLTILQIPPESPHESEDANWHTAARKPSEG